MGYQRRVHGESSRDRDKGWATQGRNTCVGRYRNALLKVHLDPSYNAHLLVQQGGAEYHQLQECQSNLSGSERVKISDDFDLRVHNAFFKSCQRCRHLRQLLRIQRLLWTPACPNHAEAGSHCCRSCCASQGVTSCGISCSNYLPQQSSCKSKWQRQRFLVNIGCALHCCLCQGASETTSARLLLICTSPPMSPRRSTPPRPPTLRAASRWTGWRSSCST